MDALLPACRRQAAALAGVALCVWLASCAYVGDPLPPALGVARPVGDLLLTQQGDELRIRFTLPAQTIEDLPLKSLSDIDLRLGALPNGDFDWHAWEAGAARIEVPPPAAGASVEVRVPAAAYTGRKIAAAVRLVNRKGRPSNWSNLNRLEVIPPLPPPATVALENVEDGIRVSFAIPRADPRLRFRILRREHQTQPSPPDAEPALAGVCETSPFVDQAVRFGQDYSYSVIAELVSDDIRAESLPATSAPLSRRDTFPPPVPAAPTAIASPTSVELTWESVSADDLAGFRLYRAANGGRWELLAELPVQFAFSDAAVSSGARYRYALTAIDERGNESARSNPVEVAVP